ncbi:MAG: hypothetical protein HY765_05995 [Rhodomicrobium sp.]|nr:hypothetical protein [Rhodomicrobium sp.]
MNRRSLLVLIIFALDALLGLAPAPSQAAPSAGQAVPAFAPKQSLLSAIGYDGCGWDYPCPPRPVSGRRVHHRHERAYIHNNYGTVNVYVDRNRRKFAAPEASPECCTGSVGPERGWEAEDYQDCGGEPCKKRCGPSCWLHRFREGYCGHGCEVYREKAEFERAHRLVEYPRPVFYREVPPPPYYERAEPRHAPVRSQPVKPDSRTPRGRFEGPKYPPSCEGGRC